MRVIKTAFITSLVLALLVALGLFFKQTSHQPPLIGSNDKDNNISRIEPDTAPSPYYLPPENPINEDIAEQPSINETIIIPYETSTSTSSKCRSQRFCDASYQGAGRRQWQRPCQALQRGDGVSQQRPKGWSVSFHGVVAPLVKAISIPFGMRLAMKTDRPTETDTLSWLVY